MSSDDSLSKLASSLVKVFENQKIAQPESKISVNRLISKLTGYYEKLRTAMDYGNEETILRRAIERILKRKLFLDTNPNSLAEDLLRELIWGGYFPNSSISQSSVTKVATSINLYLRLKDEITAKKLLPNVDVFTLILQLLSCEIDFILMPNVEKEAVSNFMFQVLRNSIEITDDSKQTRDVQVLIAVRKNFSRDDLAFLRFVLFKQIFGKLTEENFKSVAENFANGYKEITAQLSYPRKDKIFNHVKKFTPPFLILFDILMAQKGNIRKVVQDETSFKNIVFNTCQARYRNISNKVRTAIVRSFIFILFTKAFIALFIEGTFERFYFGSIQWPSIALNTLIPPLLMALAGLGIKTPDARNSQNIFLYIQALLLNENPQIAPVLSLKLKPNSTLSLKDQVFNILWFLSILLVFGLILFVLTRLHFNLLSQGIFLFFIAIIAFLTYRIYQAASIYTMISSASIFAPILDFFFVPIIRVGRSLTEGIAQINFILIIIDFIIEAPFKGILGFFEQWFVYVANKREELE